MINIHNMRDNIERMQCYQKALLEDSKLNFLYKKKHEIINSLNNKYIVSVSSNGMEVTAHLDKETTDKLIKLDELILFRTSQIQSFYNTK